MIHVEKIPQFDPCSTATWLARGRAPEHAEAIAKAWRDFPDLAPTASPEDRMARTRARVQAMKPVNDAIAAHSEAERQARNFSFTEERAVSGRGDERDAAILRGRDRYGYDWNLAIRYADGWYALCAAGHNAYYREVVIMRRSAGHKCKTAIFCHAPSH
ncbi:hypothetical protein [Sphingobium sp. EM0848]|uniref:hypothetical protein n=1 Tax=Sphingobium sp. EM0848 TaxID=2743473 RepID=UPI00159C6254|nr:hypothetical protein [Sphingobium sp. EM0848]